MNVLSRLYSWYGKRVVWIIGGVIVLLAIVGIILAATHTPVPTPNTDEGRTVSVARVSELGNNATLELVGTVEAIDEVRLQSETGGRITSVRVGLGQEVSAGETIATIENASQYASLLQAEGAYESALAGAASSDVGVAASTDALKNTRTAAWNTYRSAFVSADNVMGNTLDELFNDSNRQTLDLQEFTWERRLIRYELEDWSKQSLAITSDDDLLSYLETGVQLTERLESFIDTVYEHITSIERRTDNTSTLSVIATYKSELSAARNTLNNARASLTSATTAFENAQSALDRARISGTGGSVSAADASIKQALGSLRAAQANFNKTIIQTPIAGTVNSVSVKTGDYIGIQAPIAVIANNTALEITTYINESERSRVAIGDEVIMENDARGVITAIAPAVNFNTKKIEVRIQTDSTTLSNGETVRISIQSAEKSATTEVIQDIIIPITALKVETNRIIVFTVAEDGTLEAHPVVEGPLLGTDIIIESGITSDMEIVLDARGLNEGDSVTILQ